MFVNINGNSIEVIITKKRGNKNTYLRIKDDLKLYVTTSFLMSDKKVKSIIDENMASIVKMYQKQLYKQELKNSFYYLGKRYDLVRINTNKVSIGEEKIFVPTDFAVDKWLKTEASILFKERLD